MAASKADGVGAVNPGVEMPLARRADASIQKHGSGHGLTAGRSAMRTGTMWVRKLGTRNRLFLGKECIAHLGLPNGGNVEFLKQPDGSLILRKARAKAAASDDEEGGTV